MINKIFILLFFIALSAHPCLFASGNPEKNDASSDQMSRGLEFYNEGNLKEAAAAFKQTAASDNPDKAAAGYYNYGTVSAILAEQDTEAGRQRELLEESYDSLQRSVKLGTLPSSQQKQARQNMEIVRQKIASLPPDQQKDEQQNRNQQDNGEQQKTEQQEASGSGSEQSGQSGNREQTPQELLEDQQELTEATESGQGSDDNLADAQNQLRKAAEDAELNDAAVKQAKAAEALREGDREKAMKYQKEAEKALESAIQDESGEQEADDILNQEAEYEAQKNRLDKKGGISNAERNW